MGKDPCFRHCGSTCVIAVICGALLCSTTRTLAGVNWTEISVDSSSSLHAAVSIANGQGRTIISLEAGEYRISSVLRIDGDYITLRSAHGNPDEVKISGGGMRSTPNVNNLVEVSGSHVTITGVTLQEAGNHLVQLRGERDADYFTLTNSVLRNSFQQLLKVSSEPDSVPSADFGVVRNTDFYYSEELGPNFYIGGIDLHGGKDWLIEGNRFRNIASPARQAAEHAIHVWKGSAGNVVRENLIVNCDRGIGFGLSADRRYHNYGGLIKDNVIIHSRRDDPYSDVGIVLEGSPGTAVSGNYVHLAHVYPNGIEYRFKETVDVVVSGNISNKSIASRDGARAVMLDNRYSSRLQKAWDYVGLFVRKWGQ
ncbi:right-handed parallel beta-helix repeat-containing protein [Congregibacter brevis]|uniref:Right-handed parallel beta-helix repeat-containing protein n=1 Tax=Congregibacter brevis TaxID=3081201 RepID=A0ABZ0IHZ0_9GAMM|nr:right-handed parallel beta-helix repeat-containing protein [Congregibacter sp. IMCC45268]